VTRCLTAFQTAGRRARKIARPQRSRKTARLEEMLRYATGDSALGPVLVASSAKGIVAILIDQDAQVLPARLQHKFPRAHLIDDRRGQAGVLKKVVRFIADPARGLDLPLDIRGTPFQQKVWKAIRAIPAGKTASYSDIAIKIGAPRAARAVGTVCSTNTLAIALPCHRVLRKGGAPPVGPHWGGHQQLMLIAREQPAKPASRSRPR